MLIKVSEPVSMEQNRGTAQDGNINEGIQCYINTAILNLHYNLKYGTLLITMTKTTKTTHAAGIDITIWRIFKQFFEVYNETN
jgi:hypothetical protein